MPASATRYVRPASGRGWMRTTRVSSQPASATRRATRFEDEPAGVGDGRADRIGEGVNRHADTRSPAEVDAGRVRAGGRLGEELRQAG